MQPLTQTLEGLLLLYRARITSESDTEFEVVCHGSLPNTVQSLCLSINVSMPSYLIDAINEERTQYLHATSEYTFPIEAKEGLRALLFLASEKRRYEAFCNSIDEEITQELGTSED